MGSPEIVVGIDGSPQSERALSWAANEAARRHADLLILHVYNWYDLGMPTPVGAPFATEARAYAEELVATAVAKVRDLVPGVAVRGQAVFGNPAHELISASGDGATIVIGNRGRGGFTSLLLGSVSQQVAVHARGPVVVVRGRGDANDGPVVVGVDGSPEAEQALRLAFEEATLRGTGVVAIRAYSLVPPSYVPFATGLLEDPAARQKEEQAALAADIAPWGEKYPAVRLDYGAIEGHPAEVLARRSADACLVVVGTRGHGGFAGLLLGSVGLHLLHHANCPVLVART